MSAGKVSDSRKPNALNTIRLLVALKVVLGHAVPWLQLNIDIWNNPLFTLFQGVPVFFFISGFLIFFSVEHSMSSGEYLKKRFWRIYPELWASIIFEFIVMLLLYKEPVPAKDYVKFAFSQGSIFQFWTPDSLRGYGNGTPNGALWTISVIIQFYIIAWFLFRFLKKKNITVWAVTLVFLCEISIGLQSYENFFPIIVFKLIKNSFIPYLWLFCAGGFLANFSRELLSTVTKYWFIFIAISLCSIISDIEINAVYYGIIRALGSSLGLVGLAYRFPKLNVPEDISYGIYLYHYIFINAFITLGLTGRIWHLIAVFVFAICAAWLSTMTIGRLSKKYISVRMNGVR